MSGISLQSLLVVCIVAALALRSSAAPASLSMPNERAARQAGDELPADNYTSAVPVFNCTPVASYALSISALLSGLQIASQAINDQIAPHVDCPSFYPSVTSRFSIEEPFDLSDSAAILQAYSAAALFATQSNMVVDADKVKMEVISEILNGLIRNYFEAVTPEHCSCVSSDCTLISELRNFTDTSFFSEECTSAAYVYTHIVSELQLVNRYFVQSDEFQNVFTLGGITLVSCDDWRANYIPADSPAHNLVCRE